MKMSNSGIYKISSPTGFYIGSSKNIRKRFQDHLSALRAKRHANKILERAFYKYDQNLDFSIIETCHESELLLKEQYYIDELNPTYNICMVAGRMDGFKFSEESKQKMRGRKVNGQKVREGMLRNSTAEQRSERARYARSKWTEESKRSQIEKTKGRKVPKEVVDKIRIKLIGRPVSEETRAKLAMQKGWKHGNEARIKMSKAKTGKTGALCVNSKLILCSNGMEFHGGYEAQDWLRANGFPKAHAGRVTSVCRGDRNKAYGMTWKYIDAVY